MLQPSARSLRVLACLFALQLLAGCASLGLVEPQTFEDRIAYAYTLYTGVLEATAASLDAGRMTSEQGERIAQMGDDAQALLDSARRIHAAGDTEAATRQMALAITVLNELQLYAQE